MATTPPYIPNVDRLREYREKRRITVRQCGDLVIANYTPSTMYDRAWDEVTRICRGLILRLDRPWPEATRVEEVVALPFEKFFNLGETVVGEVGSELTAPIAEVTEKADGCLGVLFRTDDGFAIATRGSFLSSQASWATAFLRRYDLTALPENLTLLFEIIYSGSRIVVNYGGREDLILLGARDRVSGEDWFYPRVAELGARLGLTVIPAVTDLSDLAALLEASARLDANAEGWVIRCADGVRWKVKGDAYRQVHRFLSRLSERVVLDAMASGTIADLRRSTPPHFAPIVAEWHERLERRVAEKVEELSAIFAAAPKDTRKDFALWVTGRHRADAHYLFQLLDGRDPRPLILKDLRETLSAEPLVEPDEAG